MSVNLRDFTEFSFLLLMQGRNCIKFDWVIYSHHIPNCLDFGDSQLIFLILAQFLHCEMVRIGSSRDYLEITSTDSGLHTHVSYGFMSAHTCQLWILVCTHMSAMDSGVYTHVSYGFWSVHTCQLWVLVCTHMSAMGSGLYTHVSYGILSAHTCQLWVLVCTHMSAMGSGLYTHVSYRFWSAHTCQLWILVCTHMSAMGSCLHGCIS